MPLPLPLPTAKSASTENEIGNSRINLFHGMKLCLSHMFTPQRGEGGSEGERFLCLADKFQCLVAWILLGFTSLYQYSKHRYRYR